jgi:hypothetical protein
MGGFTTDCAVFFARQGPLQTAAVNRDTELLLNSLNTSGSRQFGFDCSQSPHILDDLGGQLVTFFGSAMQGEQPAQAGFQKCCVGLIDSWARNAKLGSYIDDRDPLHVVPTQHLVANLKEIFGIEEWILFEESVGN